MNIKIHYPVQNIIILLSHMGALIDQCQNPPESQEPNELQGTSAGNEDHQVQLENLDR